MNTVLAGSYDLKLVALSYIVASVASYVALDLTGRVTVTRARTRLLWLAAGSLTMGLGIWAMHFVGMLAFSLPVVVHYDVPIVVLSTVPAIVASGIALHLASRPTLGRAALGMGSVAMGAAIAGMHYVGMAALRSAATMSYRPWVVAASIVIAVAASGAALGIAFRLRTDVSQRGLALRFGAALVMGVAVAGMHYTGMGAAVFGVVDPTVLRDDAGRGYGGDLALGVAGVSLLLACATLLASLADRRASRSGILKMTVTLTAVTGAVAAICLTSLYRAGLATETERLSAFVDREARGIGVLARVRAATGAPTGATLTFLGLANREPGGFGRTGAFYLVRSVRGNVVFLGSDVRPIPIGEPGWTEPMQRALSGETGTMMLTGRHGASVLAAFQPVGELDLALVATIDLVELREPFVRAGLLAGWAALGLVLLGSIVLGRIGDPMVRRIEEGAFLDAVLASFPVPVIIEGADHTIRTVNPAFERVFGRAAAAVQGASIETCFGPCEGAATLRALADGARRGARRNGTTELPVADRTAIPVRLTAAAVAGLEDGSVVVVAEDITEVVRSQVALEDAARQAREASAAKSSFLANMSHEIRTPMNGVMGTLELLLDTELDAYQRDSATMALASAEGLLDILNDLLDFSKIEAGHVDLERIRFDLPGLISDATRIMGRNAARRGTELMVDIHRDTPTMVVGDPGRLRQVVGNLLGNAIKFTENGEVLVALRPLASSNGTVDIEFRVRDTGIGIPESKLDSIFEEFSQADVSVTRTHGGTGLGLAICRRLVGLMGGTMKVESELGKGSTFSFVVPMPVAPADAEKRLPRPAESLEGRRILVDDSDTARRIAREVMEGAGAEVDEAPDAATGLDRMRRALSRGRPYDVVITDSMMPVRDGFGFADDVMADPGLAGSRLLMLTSAGEPAGPQKAREHGIKGYLAKPVPRADMIRAVGQLLGMRGPGEGRERRLVTDESLAATRVPARILLVEDNRVNRVIATAMLEKWGHEVDVAEDGQQAVDKVREGAYDLVLMDVQMPVMDGIQATRLIRAMEGRASTPILAVTAHALGEERERCEEVGMNGFVPKPFKAERLCAAVDVALRDSRRRGGVSDEPPTTG